LPTKRRGTVRANVWRQDKPRGTGCARLKVLNDTARYEEMGTGILFAAHPTYQLGEEKEMGSGESAD
jgi:hypothetical protein